MKLTFGDNGLDYRAATSHFTYIGATGSGKTVLIRLLIQSVLGLGKKHNIPTRLLVYDSKREMMPVLYGMFERLKRDDAEQKIKLINPFDKRGVAWDIAEDITSPANAQELASILIPENPNAKEPFFPNAAKLIVESVILSFIEHSGDQWTFRDLCNAVETKDKIEKVLSRSLRTSWVIESLFGEEKTTANILATLATSMRPYRIIAALWDKAKGKISLHRWLREQDGVLVLGNSPTSRTAIDAINQVIFKRLSQIILEEQQDLDLENDPRRVWVVLDEFVRAGRLNGAVELATEGRSKGVAMVLGFQDINGLYAVYGKEVAEEIIGQCANVALLRAQNPNTAEWESRFIGDHRIKESTYSQSVNFGSEQKQGGSGTSTQEQTIDRRTLLPSYFREMKPVSKEDEQGVDGVFCSPFAPIRGVYKPSEPVSYDWLFNQGNLWSKATQQEVKGFVGCEAEDQYLEWWVDNDLRRLKLVEEKQEEVQLSPDGDLISRTLKPSRGKNLSALLDAAGHRSIE
jgi:type IV secretory pathway TraG/TraD family ATPase VirD4